MVTKGRVRVAKLDVGRGGAYIYVETFTSLILGYAFWFIMAKISTSEVIGTSAAVISLSTIFTTVVTLGIPNGVQRFLGKSFSEQKINDARIFVWISVILISIGIIISSLFFLIGQKWADNTFGIKPDLVVVTILLIASSAMTTLFRSIVIATLKTRILPIVMTISSSLKIVLSVILIMNGWEAPGLTIGYTMNQILASIILVVYLVTILGSSKAISKTSYKEVSKNILESSTVSWIPALITTIGTQLGTIIVFGSQGAHQAGVFFIAFSIFSAVSGIMFSLFTIAYPALSAMTDGRKRLTWRITKMSLILALPFSAWLTFYSKNVMQLFNQNYVEGASALEVLLLSMLPIAVLTGVSTLVYSYGNYRQVLAIGLVSSIPRTVLYFILVPLFSGMGASISYTAGSILGLIVSIAIARKIGLQMSSKELVVLFFFPLGLALPLSYLGINYIASIIIIPIITWAVLLKIGIISRSDVQDSIGILPSNISHPTLSILNKIGRKLNSSY